MAYYKKNYQPKDEKTWQEKITDKFVERIEEAIADTDKGLKWEKPFFTCNEWPVNALTGEKYKGGNTFALMLEERSDPRWVTFNQMKELATKTESELHLRKGSEGVQIQKVVPVYQKDSAGNVLKDSDGNPVPVFDENMKPKIGFKYYWVFNCEDIEGLEPYIKPNDTVKPSEAVQLLKEALMERTDLKFSERPGMAYYSPDQHLVNMPPQHHFKTSELYNDTLLHELGHSTGKALGRDLTGKFGDASYSNEELIAELHSSFMSVELGVPHNPSSHENHAAYLKSWLSVLQNDKNYLLKACSAAQKATDFNMGHYNAHKQVIDEKLDLVKQISSRLETNNKNISSSHTLK